MTTRFLTYIEKELRPPFLLITCGLPCTLKSTVADRVADLTGCAILKTDVIRRELLADEDIYDNNVAADMNKRTQVYDAMFRQADDVLGKTGCVILDATFITKELRNRAAAVAARHGTPFIIMETVCPRETALERLRNRDKATSVSNAVTEEAYLDNERRFENVDINALSRIYPSLKLLHLTVDSSSFQPESWTVTGEEKRPES